MTPLEMKYCRIQGSSVTTEKETLIAALKKQWELITPDINMDIEEYRDDHDNYFDYKNLFKNSEFVKYMSRKIKANYTRVIRRNSADSFESIYREKLGELSSNSP